MLCHNTFKIEVSKSSDIKFNQRWLGLYQISKIDALKGTYQLEELDRTRLIRTYAGNQIKKIIERDCYFYSAYDKEQRVKKGLDDKLEENLTDLVNRKGDPNNKFTQEA